MCLRLHLTALVPITLKPDEISRDGVYGGESQLERLAVSGTPFFSVSSCRSFFSSCLIEIPLFLSSFARFKMATTFGLNRKGSPGSLTQSSFMMDLSAQIKRQVRQGLCPKFSEMACMVNIR